MEKQGVVKIKQECAHSLLNQRVLFPCYTMEKVSFFEWLCQSSYLLEQLQSNIPAAGLCGPDGLSLLPVVTEFWFFEAGKTGRMPSRFIIFLALKDSAWWFGMMAVPPENETKRIVKRETTLCAGVRMGSIMSYSNAIHSEDRLEYKLSIRRNIVSTICYI